MHESGKMFHKKEKNIVIFSTADWDNPFWTNKQHMARLFAEHGYTVLYVDSLGLRAPKLVKRDLGRIARRILKGIPVPRQVQPGLWRISPLVLPFQGPLASRLNNFCLRLIIRFALWFINVKRPIIWTYNPTLSSLLKGIPNECIVYHCVDRLQASPHISATVIDEGEKQLSRISSLCFATSEALHDDMKRLFPRVVYEPNVCDRDLFEMARQPLPEPQEMASIPHPRILFVGALSDYKVDYELLEYVARKRAEYQWILIGQEGEGQPDSSCAPRLPNIHILGPRAHGMLPYYMKQCDVAALPVPRNAYTDAMFPMKFFEYLAAGLPVVATTIPALNKFKSLFFTACDKAEFVEQLDRVISGERRPEREIQDVCASHSWHARFARMESAMLEEIGRSDNKREVN